MSYTYWQKGPSLPETTNIFSPHLTDSISRTRVNKDLALPIINVVEDENIELRTQMAKVADELKKLDSLSENLVNQNSRLRSHYYERNNDLQYFVQSFKMNLAAELSDIEHQIHLLREGNCLVFKNIQTEMVKANEYKQRIDQLKAKLGRINETNTDLEENVLFPLKVRLQNRLNSGTIKTLIQKQDKLTQNQKSLWEEVANLVMVTKRLQKDNIINTKDGVFVRNQNADNRHFYRNHIVSFLKSIAELKQDIESHTALQKNQKQKNQTLLQKFQKLELEKQNKNIQKEQKLTQFNKLKSDLDFQNKDNVETITNIQKMEIQVMQRKEEREKLEKQLAEKKKAQLNARRKHQEEKLAILDEARKQIEQAKAKINQTENNFTFELKKTEKELQSTVDTIQQLKKELRQMQNDIVDYEKTYLNLDNPVKQIEKAEFKLKYLYSKKAANLRA